MKLHIVYYGSDLFKAPSQQLSGWLYWKKRLKFWKWKLHRTMGRPILMKRGKK